MSIVDTACGTVVRTQDTRVAAGASWAAIPDLVAQLRAHAPRRSAPEARVMDTDDDHVDPPVSDGLEPRPNRPGLSVTDSPTGARVIRVGTTLDATVGAELRRQVSALLARSLDPLVVDLTAVRDAEPAGASAVLREAAYEAGAADVDLRVVCDPRARGMTRAVLDDEALFEIYPTLDAALQRPPDAPPPRPGADHPGPPSPGGR